MKSSYVPIWVIIFLFAFVSIYFLIFAWSDVFYIDNSIAIYWLDANNIPLRLLLACVLLPCIVFLCILMLMRRKKVSRFVLIALVSTNGIALVALFPGILREYTQQDSVEFNDHIYYALSSIGTVGTGSQRPLIDLYECDKSSFLCRKIYRNHGSNWLLSGKTQRLPHPAANTLTLDINGTPVYTHTPP